MDLNRPQTQWSVEGRPGEWQPSAAYKTCIKNIEAAISKKLQIILLETCIVLNCKKTSQDAHESTFLIQKKEKLNINKKEQSI